ncbi:BglG family transcriptional antiterminator [Proteiniborus sp. DW1]|uniref:PRD domain-containing protein n=1 Tax=Proteiniborus sp. DW1 TaxID=1889883 RepID=UPI00092DEDC9|nr:PRD domain-containing protein [Proteiniborus sp. DW1]SCG82807.1 BglG family transcriptional antiterminator [Proteiniborus sp. DW1]
MSAKEYIVSKILNNNVILAVDYKTRQELILIGKGIGFGKKEGRKVNIHIKDVEKSFIAYDEKTKKEYLQLINQLDSNVMGVSEEIIAMAEKQLGQLSSHIHIALTDHIGFAIDRIKMGLEINNPFLYEIRALYPEEYKAGLLAAEVIKGRLNVTISESEVGFIALHFHSARQNKRVTETMKDTRLLKEIIDMIQRELSVSIDNRDLMYTRLINHLRVTLNRLDEKKYIENPLLSNIKEQFKESYRISQKIGEYIEEKKHINITEDELGYLALHIERIKETSKIISRRVTELYQA